MTPSRRASLTGREYLSYMFDIIPNIREDTETVAIICSVNMSTSQRFIREVSQRISKEFGPRSSVASADHRPLAPILK